MLLTLVLPRINEYMTTAVIRKVYATEGDALHLGAKFLDLSVDLSAVAPQDCPPVSHYRIALRDRAWLRRLDVASGDELGVGAAVALFSTDPDEPVDGEPARAVRITLAGIVHPNEWWEGSAS
jgi:hypothetical protein